MKRTVTIFLAVALDIVIDLQAYAAIAQAWVLP